MRVILALVIFLISVTVSGDERKLCENWSCGGDFDAPIGSVCEGWRFVIEPDMQISDEDLTEAKARHALEWLSANLAQKGHQYELGKENRLKIVRGFILIQYYDNAAEEDKFDTKETYCTWLKSDGFWYD